MATAACWRRAPSSLRVLFVDDDELVLRSLKRVLGREADLDLCFASGGKEALAQLEESHFDVVVSDMHMPEMDGATLLREVQLRRPESVRIVLSGHSDARLIYRAIPFAHRFISKPFDVQGLRENLGSARRLRALLGCTELLRLVGQANQLPSPPKTYVELTRLLAQPEPPLAQLAELIGADVALSARVLSLVRSAYFGVPLSGPVDIPRAVNYLGYEVLSVLVLSTGVVTMLDLPRRGLDLEHFQFRSLLTACLARDFHVAATSRGVSVEATVDEVFSAGMLHDLGQLLLWSRSPARFRRVQELARESGQPAVELERDFFYSASHAEVGAYLLGIWGLPQVVVDAVAEHHRPPQPGEALAAAQLVHAAAALAEDPDIEPGAWTASGHQLEPALADAFAQRKLLEAFRVAARA